MHVHACVCVYTVCGPVSMEGGGNSCTIGLCLYLIECPLTSCLSVYVSSLSNSVHGTTPCER